MKIRLLLALLSAVTLAFAVDIITTSCITRDDEEHAANGGTPLPGAISIATSDSSQVVDGVDRNSAISAPIDLHLGKLGLFIIFK